MDWSNQVENMMSAWMETQKKAWDGFFSSMKSMHSTMQDMASMPGMPGAMKSPPVRMWDSTLSAGHEMFTQMFKTHGQWLGAWVDNLANMPGVPAQAVESARQLQEMTARWSKTQTELIENWFSAMKKMLPSQPGDAWEEIPSAMFKTWQNTTQSIMDAQMKWMQSWASKMEKPADE